jgi:hypothetical protein
MSKDRKRVEKINKVLSPQLYYRKLEKGAEPQQGDRAIQFIESNDGYAWFRPTTASEIPEVKEIMEAEGRKQSRLIDERDEWKRKAEQLTQSILELSNGLH